MTFQFHVTWKVTSM